MVLKPEFVSACSDASPTISKSLFSIVFSFAGRKV